MSGDASRSDRGMRRHVGTVGLFTMASRVLGLVREWLMAHFVGAGLESSAFYVAFAIPNFARRLFGEGALTSAFVPVFKGLAERDRMVEARRLARAVATMAWLMLGAFVVLGVLALSGLVSGWGSVLAAWNAAFRAWAERVADAFAGAAGAPGDAESVRARAEALAAWREARFSADRETKESLSRPPVPLLAGGVTTGGALAPPPLPQIRRLSPGRKTLTPTTTSAEGAE